MPSGLASDANPRNAPVSCWYRRLAAARSCRSRCASGLRSNGALSSVATSAQSRPRAAIVAGACLHMWPVDDATYVALAVLITAYAALVMVSTICVDDIGVVADAAAATSAASRAAAGWTRLTSKVDMVPHASAGALVALGCWLMAKASACTSGAMLPFSFLHNKKNGL